MKILHVEEWTSETDIFIRSLHAATGCAIEHARSVDEGLFKLVLNGGRIDIVTLTVERDDVFRVPRTGKDDGSK